MLEAAAGSYIGLRSTIFLEAPILASKCWFVAKKNEKVEEIQQT